MKYMTKRIEPNLKILREKGVKEKDIIYFHTKVYPDTEILPTLEICDGQTREGKISERCTITDEDVTVLLSWDPELQVNGESNKDRYAMDIYLTLGALKQNNAKTITAVLLETPYKSSHQLISLFERQLSRLTDKVISLDDFLNTV